MDETTMLVLIFLAMFMSLAAVCVSFALLDKVQKLDNRTLENRASIDRHTGRLRKIDDTYRRIDRTIDDIYEKVGDHELLWRQYFQEVGKLEDTDKK